MLGVQTPTLDVAPSRVRHRPVPFATASPPVPARSAAQKTKQDPAGAPPAWRSWVTAALIVHLFCLGLALLSNAGGGQSRVGYSLRKIPLAPRYLKLLGMDVGYDFDLAGSTPQLAVHRLEVAAPASAAPLTVLPAADVRWQARRHRYQRLAYYVAEMDDVFSENSDLQTMMPLAIADAWLRQQQLPSQRYILTVRRETTPRWPAAPEEERDRSPTSTEGDAKQTGAPSAPATEQPVVIDLVWNAKQDRYEGSRRQPAALTAKAVVKSRPADAATRGSGADAAEDSQ